VFSSIEIITAMTMKNSLAMVRVVRKKAKFRRNISLPSSGTKNDVSNSFYVVACVLMPAVTFLPSRCLATIEGYTYRHTDQWERFMKYAGVMESCAMICVPDLIKIGSGIGGAYTDTQTAC
jgi:hypothetical protein